MPLVNGIFEDLVLPSAKHARVLCDSSKPWRYRVLHGGRNGYKDWSAAAVAVERAVRVSTRYLCTREVQLTIADSAHQLIKDTIHRLGYDDYFKVTDNKIKCLTNDSSFIFRGLNDLVSEDVKSMEGIDVCIIGEAQNLTFKSMTDLDPTIRKPNSEIWIIFNDKFETDFVHEFCIKSPPDNMIVELVNYTDAPEWMLSPVILEQAERMKRENFALYENVWLGMPLKTGLFFGEFGDHNAETPFIIPEDYDNHRLFASLDHGIAHNTAFSLAWLDNSGVMHTIFTYSNNGGTTASHAQAILETLEACRFSRYLYPCEVFYDYAMETKHKISEQHYRSDLDEYLDAFKAKEGARATVFTPANKRKIDGCHIMRSVFSNGTGMPLFRYFDGLNDALVKSVKAAETDDLNAEIYAKQDGDDECDSIRYLIMGVVARSASIKANLAGKPKEKAVVPRPLEAMPQYGGLS